MMEKLGSFMRFWPAIVALAVLAFGIAETRWQVQQLVADKETDRTQWQKLGEHSSRLTNLESWKTTVDRVITPEGMQEWGRVKSDVERHEREIERLKAR